MHFKYNNNYNIIDTKKYAVFTSIKNLIKIIFRVFKYLLKFVLINILYQYRYIINVVISVIIVITDNFILITGSLKFNKHNNFQQIHFHLTRLL